MEKYAELIKDLQELEHTASFKPLVLGSRVPITPQDYHKLENLTGLTQRSEDFNLLLNKIYTHTLRDLQRTQATHNLLRMQNITSTTSEPQIQRRPKHKRKTPNGTQKESFCGKTKT